MKNMGIVTLDEDGHRHRAAGKNAYIHIEMDTYKLTHTWRNRYTNMKQTRIQTHRGCGSRYIHGNRLP